MTTPAATQAKAAAARTGETRPARIFCILSSVWRLTMRCLVMFDERWSVVVTGESAVLVIAGTARYCRRVRCGAVLLRACGTGTTFYVRTR